jgi:hypothetical protein
VTTREAGWALPVARLGLVFFLAGVWKVFQPGPLEDACK